MATEFFWGKNFKLSITKSMVEIKPQSIEWLNFFGHYPTNWVANFQYSIWQPKQLFFLSHMSAIEGDQKLMNKILNIAQNFMGMIKTNLIIGPIAIVDWMIKIL
jgi:hypothetical protein